MGPDKQESDESSQSNNNLSESQETNNELNQTAAAENNSQSKSLSDSSSTEIPVNTESNSDEATVDSGPANPDADNPSSLNEALAQLSAENEAAPAVTVDNSQSAPDPTQPTGVEPSKSKRKKGWLWALIAILVIIILGLLWLFFMYLPNRPSAVYSSSMNRTGQAVDKLIDYAKNANSDSYKNVAVTGTATVNGKNYKFTGGLDGSYNQNGNTTTTLNVDSKTEGNTNSRVKATFDLRTLKDADQTYPDIYLRATGVSNLLDMLGASQFDSLDGKWIEVSHNLIKQYADEYTDQTNADKTKNPTKTQVYDAIDKVQAVNKKYLFTDNPNTAILVKKKYVGAETKYGRDVYHYKVGWGSKSHITAYIDALGKALDSSKLNDWSQKNFKKDLSEQIDINSVKQSAEKNYDANYRFDLWADRDTKLIEAIEFKDKNNPGSSVTFAQTYSGGHVYPFRVEVNGNEDGDKGSLTMEFTLDADKNQATMSFNFNDDNHGNKTTAEGNFKVTESNNNAKVDRPKDAMPIEKILGIPIVGAKPTKNTVSKSDTSKGASPAISEIQTKADNAKIQSDAAILLTETSVYTANNNGKQPKFAVQMGQTVQLCDNAGCTGTAPVSFKLASKDKVVVGDSAPNAGDQIVLAPGMKCNGDKLAKASSRETAVSYYLGKTLTCQQA